MDAAGAWIVAGSVIFFVAWALVHLWEFRGSGKWPTANGTVEGEVEIRPSQREYHGIIKYSYVAGNDRYSGEWLTPVFVKRDQVASFAAAHFPPGQGVTVKYHPRTPQRSTLEVDPGIYKRDDLIELNL